MRRQLSKAAPALHLTFSASLFLTLLTASALLAVPAAQAQNYSVIHSFSDGLGGAWPWSELTLANAGHLYGTTFHGGNGSQQECQLDPVQEGCGIVYDLYQRNGQWTFQTLVAFQIQDGAYSHLGVTLGRDGALYGAASTGGQMASSCIGSGCGTVYKIQPSPTRPATALSLWNLTVLYDFMGTNTDGGNPSSGLVLDATGNMYGADNGGPTNCGVIYRLTHSGGDWALTDIYNSFYCPDGYDGIAPGGMVFDSLGNLYGITFYGGHGSCTYAPEGCGTVFMLTNTVSGWIATTLHEFNASTDGALPGGLVMDAAGNLYGGTETGGPGNGGTVWELSPSGGSWTFNVLYTFQHTENFAGVVGRLAMDSAGSLYGVTMAEGGFGDGNVFKLTPTNGSWTYTDLYDFQGGNDGSGPLQGVTLDANGDIFGTTYYGGGPGNNGTVWEITP